MTAILPISQLTMILKGIIEDDDALHDVWVDGEISNLTIARSGHAYFTLKDDESQLASVMWKNAVIRQHPMPREGDRVIAHGNVTVYHPRGTVQLQVDLMQPHGAGLIQLQLEQLRQKLEAEGLFDADRKRPLPTFPRTIGVVTSASGAVWHDIQVVMERRYPLAELVLSPSMVQGEGAAQSLVAALQRLQDEAAPDVIIIGRGGGSAEDLLAFNDERVVRAIFACKVPVISAVGHETDVTLADSVADVRAATPSAAAELAGPELAMIDATLVEARQRLVALMDEAFATRAQRLDDLQDRLARVSPASGLQALAQEVAGFQARATVSIRHALRLARRDLGAQSELLQALAPQQMFARGYAFVQTPAGAPVRSVTNVRAGDEIFTIVRDGTITSTVAATTSPRETGC